LCATVRGFAGFVVLGVDTHLDFHVAVALDRLFLITDVLFGGVVATVATVAIGAVFAWVWSGQLLLRLRD
jgi:hypothetical protein